MFPSTSSSLYSILNLSPTASTEEIQKSFKLLSKSFHPDKQQQQYRSFVQQGFIDDPSNDNDVDYNDNNYSNNDRYTKNFLELKHAYDILINPVLRFTYDEYGYDAVLLVQSKRTVSSSSSSSSFDNNNVDDDYESGEEEEEEEYNHIFRKKEEAQTSSTSSKWSDKSITLYHALYILFIQQKDIQAARTLLEQELQNQRYQQYQTMNYYYYNNRHQDTYEDDSNQHHHLLMGGETHITRQGSIEISCTTVHSPLLGEGYNNNNGSQSLKFGCIEDAIQGNWLEVDKSKMGLTYTFPLLMMSNHGNFNTNAKDGYNRSSITRWNASLGGNTVLKNGEGQSTAFAGVGYTPTTGTEINLQCHTDLQDGTEQYKLSLETSRVMANGSYISTGITTIPNANQFSYNIFSHRSLFQNKYSGTWGFGLGSNFDFHFFMFSLTTLQKHIPRMTFKFNLGADKYPFRFSLQQELPINLYNPSTWIATSSYKKHSISRKKSFQTHKKSHRGELSVGFSTTADIELKLTSTQTLSRFCHLTIGLQHISSRGLTWFIKVTRGETSFTVPILLTLASSTNYWIKTLYVSIWTVLLDMSISEWLHQHDEIQSFIYPNYDHLLRKNIKHRDQALREQSLMVKVAASKRENDDLVILKATYEVHDGDKLDVTIALQCWVVDSHLSLSSGTKRSLLGFYDVVPSRRTTKKSDAESLWPNFFQFFPLSYRLTNGKVYDAAYFTIRYKTTEGVFEVVIQDECPLELPHPLALKLDGSNIL